jgi:hypothetical protein
MDMNGNNVAIPDAEKYLLPEKPLINIRVFRCGMAVPDPTHHLILLNV